MSDDSSRTVPRAPDMAYRVAPAAVAGLLWVLGPADGAHETVVTAGPRALLAGLVIAAVVAGVGDRLLTLLRVDPPGRAQRVAYAIALGMGATSIVVMVVALCHLHSRHAAALLLILGSLAFPCRNVAVAAWGGVRDSKPRASVGMLVCLVVLVLLALSFVALGVLPPTDTDSLRYHLRLPELMLETHAFTYPPRNHFAHLPLGGRASVLARAGSLRRRIATMGP